MEDVRLFVVSKSGINQNVSFKQTFPSQCVLQSLLIIKCAGCVRLHCGSAACVCSDYWMGNFVLLCVRPSALFYN